MNNQNLIICDFKILFDILSEIQDDLNFKLINTTQKNYTNLNLNKSDNYISISKKKIPNLINYIDLEDYPLQVHKLIEIININFLKNRFNQQSDIDIGFYKLNLNSRKLLNNEKILNLTEKEADIILYLKNSKKPVNINQLQSSVWGYNSKLETHTVETHIYRLRKKINDLFNDDKFIISTKDGYIIN